MAISRNTLFDVFAESGHQLWLVGGALRDRFLGRDSHDFDYATDATPDEIESMLGARGATLTTVGKRFGTIGVLVDDEGAGNWSEITTFRGDSYSDGQRWPDVTFGGSIEEDLRRRDFTINALAENVFDGTLLDLFGGRADAEARVIRALANRFSDLQKTRCASLEVSG